MSGLPANRAAPTSSGDRQLIERIFSNPLVFPVVFKQWLIAYLGPEIQVTQSQVVNATTAVFVGAGTPEGAQAANVGSVFLRTDGGPGTTIYVKETGSGTTGWVQRDVFNNGLTIADGKDIAIGGGTGSKIGQTSSRIAFFGVTPAARPSAYTQTYSTADKTHANPTASTLTDNSAGTANTTVQALPDPADTPATADALRDDLVANLIPALRNNTADVAAQINALIADIADVKQLLNAVIDDLQTLGILA